VVNKEISTDQIMMSKLQALSTYWRKNTSTLESVELANLLKALRKVVGHLGPNAGSVDYAGMSAINASSIIVDPAAITGSYPVAAEKTDLLVGEVVHEALLRIEWSEHVWKTLNSSFSDMGGIALVKFQKLIKVGEDIYADSILDGAVLGKYLAVARNNSLTRNMKHSAFSKSSSSFDALVILWQAATFGDQKSVMIDKRHNEPLVVLMGLSAALAASRLDKSGVTSRCEKRSILYKDAWSRIEALVQDLPLLDKRLFWFQEQQGNTCNKKNSVLSQSQSPGISPGLVRDIESQLAYTSSDITPLIQKVVGYDNPEVVPTSRWDYHIPAHPVTDRALAGRISAIFRSYSEREKIVSRGLASGKIDERRLHRSPVTGRCFKYLETQPTMDWNITLLIDASGSMRGTKWRTVENTVSTLHRALKGYRNNLSAYAYFEIDGICMISSLIKDDKVLSVPPCGQTASGQAIIATALFMPKTKRRRLLIHITDGESNYGLNVTAAIDFCKANHIHLVTLGCGCRDMNAMQAQYGKSIEFIGGFRMLPQAIERLLRWTFLYGSKMPALGVKTALAAQKVPRNDVDQGTL
jgi:hypothetical protein